MLRRLYDWTLELAGRRHALWALAAVSFIESSVFPIPPDVVLVAIILARPERAWVAALVCTLASAAGGLAGYAIGFLLYDTVGRSVLEFYGYLDRFTEFQAAYNEHGWLIVFGAGLTPFPYKVITIASGVTQLDLATFFVASVVGRGLRFFVVAALFWRFGPPIRSVIERYFGLATALFFALLVGGFLAVRWLA